MVDGLGNSNEPLGKILSVLEIFRTNPINLSANFKKDSLDYSNGMYNELYFINGKSNVRLSDMNNVLNIMVRYQADISCNLHSLSLTTIENPIYNIFKALGLQLKYR